MRKSISLKELIFSVICNGINSIIYTCYIYTIFVDLTQFLYLTRISCHLNSISLLLCLISDIILYFGKETVFENIQDQIRNNISPVINPVSYLTMFGFWLFFLIARDKPWNDTRDFMSDFYIHFIINIIITIDLFIANHNRERFNWKNLIYTYIYLTLYGIIFCVTYFHFKYKIYPLADMLNEWQMFLMALCLYVILTLSYCMYVLFSYIKYKYIIEDTDIDYYNNKLAEDEYNKDDCEEKEKLKCNYENPGYWL